MSDDFRGAISVLYSCYFGIHCLWLYWLKSINGDEKWTLSYRIYRVGRFLPDSGKTVFSMLKTGLAQIVFASKNRFLRSYIWIKVQSATVLTNVANTLVEKCSEKRQGWNEPWVFTSCCPSTVSCCELASAECIFSNSNAVVHQLSGWCSVITCSWQSSWRLGYRQWWSCSFTIRHEWWSYAAECWCRNSSITSQAEWQSQWIWDIEGPFVTALILIFMTSHVYLLAVLTILVTKDYSLSSFKLAAIYWFWHLSVFYWFTRWLLRCFHFF